MQKALCVSMHVCVFNYISLGSSSVVLPYSSTMIGVSFFSHRGFLWQLRKKRKPWGGLKYDVSTRYASLSVSLRLMSSTMSYYLCNRKAMPASFFFFLTCLLLLMSIFDSLKKARHDTQLAVIAEVLPSQLFVQNLQWGRFDSAVFLCTFSSLRTRRCLWCEIRCRRKGTAEA